MWAQSRLPAWISEVGYGGFPDLPRNVARYRREGNPLAPDYRFHERLLTSLEHVMEAHRLRELFPDASALCLASQQIQADGNKLQIEAMRLNPRLAGYCLHAFTDGDWVLGAGVLDMWREPKRLYQAVQEANQPLTLIVRAAPQNIYAEMGTRSGRHFRQRQAPLQKPSWSSRSVTSRGRWSAKWEPA